ncbi:MAG: DUF2911 domain-containing protein, partial [Candidatus Hydrogenedentales bacterium]
MKPFLFSIAVVTGLITAAHASEPAEGSPEASVMQVVGGGEMRIDFSRPGVKGRTIWGDIVPYGKVWRAGANDKTAFAFEDDVVISGRLLPPGKYSFYAIPEQEQWTLIFNSDWEGHGTEHTEDADVLRFTVTPAEAPHEEWLRYGFDALEDNAATIYLHWADKWVAFRVEILPGLSDDQRAVLQTLDGLISAASEQRLEDLLEHFSEEFVSGALESGEQINDLLTTAAQQGLLERLEPDYASAKVTVVRSSFAPTLVV